MKNKTGLILEGGGMRGIFTTGVLDAFIENKITFDNVVGVSAGACHGCSYVSNQYKRGFNVSISYLKDKRYCSFHSLITTGDLFGSDFIYNEIPNKLNIIDNDYFKKSKTKFEVVVTNCKTGKPEYMEVKDLKKDALYVRASSSLPFLSRIVKINEEEYLDGGLSDSIPLEYFLNKGINKNVLILTRPLKYRKSPNKYTRLIKFRYKNYPNLIKNMLERHENYNKTIDFIEGMESKGKVFVIRPPHALEIGRIEKNYNKLEESYKLGYEAGLSKIKELKIYLNK